MENNNGILIKNFSLKNVSSFKIGGRVKYYFIPDSLDSLISTLSWIRKKKVPYYIIGNASNILFNDKFYPGIIINLKGFTSYLTKNNNIIECGAGLLLNTLIDFVINDSLKGIENLSGIPGTVGGALIMNAGAFDQEISNCVETVTVLNNYNKIEILPKREIDFSYRKAVPLNKYIIISATFKFKKGDKNKLLKQKTDILLHRSIKHPWQYPSCGSIFKRPKNNYAGALIEQSNLKGFQIGGAQISEKHCNFIINKKDATARDVLSLIRYTQRQIYKKFRIKLEPEIKFFNF